MKKVLIIANRDLGSSGVPSVIMSIVRKLSTEYRFDIVVFEKEYGVHSSEFEKFGGRIIYFDLKKPKTKIGKLFFYLIGYSKMIFKLSKEKINFREYDIIHSFKDYNSYPFMTLARKFNISNRILHINGVYINHKNVFVTIFRNLLRIKSIRYATKRIAVSEISGKSFFKNRDFETVYNPYNDEKYFDLGIAPENYSILQIGTYSSRKNQLFSLEVFTIIKDKFPSASLHFMGYEAEQGYLDKLKKYILENNIKSVYFHDADSDQIKLLKESSLCLFPSISEAFGLVAVENQACGRPVLCSPQVIHDIDCGAAIFLDLKPEIWADVVVKIFNREISFNINTDRFKQKTYCDRIKRIYSL